MADFVDIATIKVNNTLVRKVTNNSRSPYLINLSKFRIGDTLKIDVWTDHGAERNSFITIKNEESHHTDTLDYGEHFIITSDLLEQQHSISAISLFSYPKERKLLGIFALLHQTIELNCSMKILMTFEIF
ncbi:MAG: hypothetical protein EP338_07840 [Bacteroidetes bacterium]|nr:MAG: hypothetical protein EP338_07840 [Bacteroidota bacterium]